jgi:hypothetical protein
MRCSFCNKSQDEARKLIAGPAVFICDECVDVCRDIIADDTRLSGGEGAQLNAEPTRLSPAPAGGLAVPCALCGMTTPFDHLVLVRDRGALCPGCIGEIEATIAERAQQE